MYADEALDEILRESVTSVLKPAGFRKTAKSYHRRRGSCIQVVNVQGSQWSSSDEKRFYVNVGLAFDEVCRLTNRPISEKPKEYECDDRGTRDRLEDLVSGAAAHWDVNPETDLAGTIRRLRAAMTALVAELDCIDGPSAYRSHRWFDRHGPVPANAQILYVLGDRTGAKAVVEQLATRFADRQNANRPEWWIERLGLTDLRDADEA